MAESMMIVLWIGSISLVLLVVFAFLYYRRRKHHGKKESMITKETGGKKVEGAMTYSSNERLDGARVSHRRLHPDRISEETQWKQMKERESIEYQKKRDSERKNRMLVVYSPCNGDVIAIHESKEDAIQDGYVNPGVLLIPKDDLLYAPISGRVSWDGADLSTVHLVSDEGTQVMVQCKYKQEDSSISEFYDRKVMDQGSINTGEILCRLPKDLIKKSDRTLQIRMEINNYQKGQLLIIKRSNYVSHGDKVLTLRLET